MSRTVETTASQQATYDISSRIDRLPRLTRTHKIVVGVLAGLFIFDIMDLSSFGLVAPSIREEWGLSLEQIGLISSTFFVGMFLGGLVGGRLADKFGRRPVLIVAVCVFSLFSILTGLAPTPELLAAARIGTGFAIQAATGAVLLYVSEFYPKPTRGRIMALVLGTALFGGPIIAFFARAVVPIGGWRWVFIVGGLGIIIALITFKLLPESPKWLAANGRHDDALKQVKAFEAAIEAGGHVLPSPEPRPTDEIVVSHSPLELFRRPLIRRTLVGSGAFVCLILLNYGFQLWSPTILVERGYDQASALTFASVLSFANILGSFAALLLIDRIERKILIACIAGLMGVFYLIVGFSGLIPVLLLLGFLAQGLGQTVSAVMYTFVPEMFPTPVRGIGAGLSNSMGRVAGIFSGIIITAIIAAFSLEGVFVYFAIVAALLGVIALCGPWIGVRKARLVVKAARASK